MGMETQDEIGLDPVLTTDEIDAIGEVLNISMGSAATAISTMLDRQVIITTPKVTVEKFYDVSYAELEPAIMVRIEYVEGISGCNVMVFRQADMQIILNLLMGNDEGLDDNFVFDELSMSAACEVMNQMMGSSATALSEFLGKSINISTPTATILDATHVFANEVGIPNESKIISVGFNLNIEGVMNSDFISIMDTALAKMIVNQVMGTEDVSAPPVVPVQQSQPVAPPPQAAAPAMPPPIQQQTQAPQQMPAQQIPPVPDTAQAAAQMAMQQQLAAQMQSSQMAQQQFPGQMQPGQTAPQYPGQPYPPQMQPQYPGQAAYPGMPPYYPPYGAGMPYGYPPHQEEQHPVRVQETVNVQPAQFPSFSQTEPILSAPLTKANMSLLMNVPLSVTVEIGKTKRKIKDIMDFNQGTVIELEKQAGAPVDIVVNGQLIARGDVVVIDDNFGVRVTEIVGTKELIGTLSNAAN